MFPNKRTLVIACIAFVWLGLSITLFFVNSIGSDIQPEGRTSRAYKIAMLIYFPIGLTLIVLFADKMLDDRATKCLAGYVLAYFRRA